MKDVLLGRGQCLQELYVHLARDRDKWREFVMGRQAVQVNPPRCNKVFFVNCFAGSDVENWGRGKKNLRNSREFS